MKIEQEQNAWDVRMIAVGGIFPVLLIAILGLGSGLVLSVLVYWILSMKRCFRDLEPEVEPAFQEVMLHSGEIV